MRLNRTRWSTVALCMLVAANALAIGGGDDGDPKNGLSSQAFLRNPLTTNQHALQILRAHALDNALFTVEDGYIARQLHEHAALAMAAELAKCALNDQTELIYRDPQNGNESHLKGELGLCQRSEAGDWSTQPPTEACQQLVTACVMARVNALGKAIPLSLRGRSERLVPLREQVSTVRLFRESPPQQDPSEGTLIPSFAPTCGPDRDCNWQPAHVGTCRPGDRIRLTLDGSSPGGLQLRVCGGIHGCTWPTSAGALGGPPPSYSKHIGDFLPLPAADGVTSIEFACPGGIQIGGNYSVMTQTAPAGAPVKLRAGAGSYPANERSVFGFVEGAFYGNLFEPDKLTQSCEVNKDAGEMSCRPVNGARGASEVCPIQCGVTSCRRQLAGIPYANVHACYSLAQQVDSELGNLGVAYLNSRICDRPDGHCFPEPPRPCIGTTAESARCVWHGDTSSFEDCKGPGGHPSSFRPITTYLNDACDVIGDGVLCDKVRTLPPPKPDEADGSWCRHGCSRTASAGDAIVLLLAAAVLVFLLRRRRDAAIVSRERGTTPPPA